MRFHKTPTINTLTPHHDMVRALRHLHRWGYSSAVIAGGAIRDMYFQNQIKDIDIYLWDPTCKGNTERIVKHTRVIDDKYIWELMDCGGQSPFWRTDYVEQTGLGEDQEYTVTKYVNQVWTVDKNDTTYQLIFVNMNPVQYVNEFFDIGICKAYCDGYKLRFTQDFLNDAINETLTICGHGLTQRHFDYILENHLKRLKSKFPNFTTKVSPHNIHFVDDGNDHLL